MRGTATFVLVEPCLLGSAIMEQFYHALSMMRIMRFFSLNSGVMAVMRKSNKEKSLPIRRNATVLSAWASTLWSIWSRVHRGIHRKGLPSRLTRQKLLSIWAYHCVTLG